MEDGDTGKYHSRSFLYFQVGKWVVSDAFQRR